MGPPRSCAGTVGRTTAVRRPISLSVLALVLAFGCARGPDPLAAEPVATTEVAVADNVFAPIAVAVPVGTEVVWSWEAWPAATSWARGLSPNSSTAW